jgi:hypothetical protein
MRDLDMGQGIELTYGDFASQASLTIGRAVLCTPFGRRARSDAPYHKSLASPA